MRKKLSIFLILLFFLSTYSLTSKMAIATDVQSTYPPVIEQEPMGVAIIDDIHDNDYADGSLTSIYDDLDNLGYVVGYASEYDSWSAALENAHYLLMTAPYSSISTADIAAVKTWFDSGAKNLLLASRGDFETIDYASMNSMLTDLGSTITVQDDNVYTTDPAAYQAWYIDTDNFNSEYADLFTGVNSVSFFSPSSVTVGSSGAVLVNAEAEAYQTNQNGDPPATVFDDTDDGSGGASIPLAVLEQVSVGSEADQIIAMGTTMWSDFDYGDSFADDPVMIENMISYFRDKIIEVEGGITIGLEDNDPPNAQISFPRNGAILNGEVTITADVSDAYGIDTVQIFIDGELRSSESTYKWNTADDGNGEYEVKVVAKDAAGNSAEDTNTYYVYDAFEPVLNSTAKVMTYNIKESGVYPAWMDVVKEENPDILILVETGNFDDNSNKLLNEYTSQFNDYFIDQVPYKSYTLQDIPDSFNGITLMSRFDIKSSEKINKVTADNGTVVNVGLPFLHTVLEVGDEQVHVIGAHLTAFPEGKQQRKDQTEGIINFMDNLGDVPILYMGDLNSESPDDTSDNGPNDLGTAAIEMMLDSSASTVHTFYDAHVEVGSGAGNSYMVEPYVSRIDYIFVNQYFNDLLLSSTTGDTQSASIGSDHVPVDVVIDLSSFGIEPFTLPDLSESNSPDSPLPIPVMAVFLAIVVPVISRKLKR